MKAFVAITLLVASVAAQSSLDVLRVNKLQRPLTGLLGQERYGSILDRTVGDLDLPIYDRLNVDRSTILSIEEIYQTELFQEYLAIPLFREYIQYPIFRQYIASPLFQQFWVNRVFQTYFRNPYLFQKYILPQVQVVSQIYGPVSPVSTGVYDRNVFDRFRGINTDVLNRDIVKNLYGDLNLGSRIVRDDVNLDVLRGIEGLTNVDERRALPYYPRQVDNVNYRFLLDRINRNLINKPVEGQITEVKTDIKVLPETRVGEQIVGKLVTPFVEGIKVVDEVVPVQDRLTVPVQERLVDTVVEGELLKEQLLKKLYLSKVLGKNVLTIKDIQTLKNLPLIEEEFNRLRNIYPAGLPRTVEQELINTPIVDSIYARQGKDVYRTLEADKLSYVNQPLINKYLNSQLYLNKDIKNVQYPLYNYYNTQA